MMVRRTLPATLLLLGLLTLVACDPTQNVPADVNPTIYVAPATPTAYIPPPPPQP